MMNWVKPHLGCAEAVSKNWSDVSTEQKSALSGGSSLQVPACQPEFTCGFSGSLGAMMSSVPACATGTLSASAKPANKAMNLARPPADLPFSRFIQKGFYPILMT